MALTKRSPPPTEVFFSILLLSVSIGLFALIFRVVQAPAAAAETASTIGEPLEIIPTTQNRQSAARAKPLRTFVDQAKSQRILIERRTSEAGQMVNNADLLCAKWTENSFRNAAEQYDKAAMIWASIFDFGSASNAALKSGDVYYLLSEYRESSKRYESALTFATRTGDWLAKARALSQMGRLQCYLGNNESAEKKLSEALRLFKQHEADRSALAANAHGEALSNLAEVTYATGNFLKASQQLESALTILQSDPKSQAKIHLFMGYIAGSIGEIEKAATEISQALDLYRLVKDKSGEALALTALGVWHSRTGQESRAMELHRQAIEIFRSIGDRHSVAIAMNALGQSHQNLGEYSIAISEYENALRLHQQIGSVDGASVTAFQIASAYKASGNSDRALRYYKQSLRLCRDAGKTRMEAYALNKIAEIYALQGRRETTVAQYARILKFYENIGDLRGQATALNAHGDFLLQSGRPKEALTAYLRALPLSEEMGDQEILISTLYNLAQVNLDLGFPEAALAPIQRSLTIIEDLRANVESPDLRASYFSGVQKHYKLCEQVLMQLERLRPGQGFALEALLVSERGRARLLRDLMVKSLTDLRGQVPNELIDRERRLRELLRVQAQYQMDLSLNKPDPAELGKADNQIVQLRAEYQEVQAQLSKYRPRPLSDERVAPLDLQQIQNQLRDSDTMLLEYSLGERSSYLWAITSTSFHSYELPSRKVIEDAAHECYALMTARPETGGQVADYQARVEAADRLLAEKTTKLSEMLLGPLAGQLGTKRLLVVPEGALRYVPFDALPLPVGELVASAGLKNKSLLLETHEVVVLPSISTLIAIRKRQYNFGSNRKLVAVIADPVFSDSDVRLQKKTVSAESGFEEAGKTSGQSVSGVPEALTRDGRLGRLAHASEEADAIATLAPWGTTLLARGFDASRKTITNSNVGQYQIVHFATHAFLDYEHPELSGIVLSMLDREGAKTDGMMSLQDIYGLDFSTELTVLSACQTALGRDLKGEGFVGLTHAFMSAGSKSVVASVWNIDDRATAFLMSDFYESMLRKGMTPSAALRSAKLRMMRDRRWGSPYYWAGFVLQGEYADHIAVDPPSSISLVLVIFLTLVPTGLLVRQKWRSRFLRRRPNGTD